MRTAQEGDRAMRRLIEEFYWRNLRASAKGMSASSYALLAGMVVLLIAVVVMATLGWNSTAGTDVPPIGYAAMAAGVLFSLVVGVGLMALVFYSSRAGYDEPAKLIVPDGDDDPGRGASS
jgi:purine-cytosine permease-like protein